METMYTRSRHSRMHSEVEDDILQILDKGAADEEWLFENIERLHTDGGDAVYCDLFRILVNLDFSAEEAAKHWDAVMQRREQLAAALGRDMNFRVVMLDYFLQEKKRIINPKVVEIKLYEKALNIAMVDDLTKVFNRRYYDMIIETEIKRAQRHNRKLTMAVIDIDDFKLYNDQYGHAEGDRVLAAFGNFLRASFRKEDILCRYGGEEFVVVMPETDVHAARGVMQRFQDEVKTVRFINDSYITFSCGLAAFPADAKDGAELFIKADKAMYISKANGKDGVTVYGTERRKNPRNGATCEVTFLPLAVKDDDAEYWQNKTTVLSGSVRDISSEGLCLETDIDVPVGQRFRLRFIDDDGSDCAEIGLQTAEILWKKSIDGRCRLGLQFIEPNYQLLEA